MPNSVSLKPEGRVAQRSASTGEIPNHEGNAEVKQSKDKELPISPLIVSPESNKYDNFSDETNSNESSKDEIAARVELNAGSDGHDDNPHNSGGKFLTTTNVKNT